MREEGVLLNRKECWEAYSKGRSEYNPSKNPYDRGFSDDFIIEFGIEAVAKAEARKLLRWFFMRQRATRETGFLFYVPLEDMQALKEIVEG